MIALSNAAAADVVVDEAGRCSFIHSSNDIIDELLLLVV